MEVMFRSPLGALLAKPGVDRAGLFGLERWYFLLSRLRAAANAAGENTARFRDEIGAGVAAWPALPRAAPPPGWLSWAGAWPSRSRRITASVPARPLWRRAVLCRRSDQLD